MKKLIIDKSKSKRKIDSQTIINGLAAEEIEINKKLHKCIHDLIKNSEPLEPDIQKLVNKHWNDLSRGFNGEKKEDQTNT